MGILQGGQLVQWMDIAAAVCAQTHAEKICVTASIDKARFFAPARVGDIIHLEAVITCAFTSSMEIYVKANKQTIGQPHKHLIGDTLLTFVAIDDQGNPASVFKIKPTNKEEQQRYEEAKSRRSGRK